MLIMQRILIIRFSSIGDIVLTTPVIRALRTKFPKADIRYATKSQYAELVEPNPNLNGVFLLKESLKSLVQELQEFDPELVVDLHHNLRTRILRTQIGGKWLAFKKLNIEKWLKVNLKVDKLPKEHVVDRYLETLSAFNIPSDGKGLDFFFPDQFQPSKVLASFENRYMAVVIGAKFKTKQLPLEKLIEICNGLSKPVILIGGKEDRLLGSEVESGSTNNIYNACGEENLLGSAWIVKNAMAVVTHDTGMMHIAAAFNKKIISVWGNTIPEFGMYPYMADSTKDQFISEVADLSCRPCSKIGYEKCPKGHFDCMQKQNVTAIVEKVNLFLKS